MKFSIFLLLLIYQEINAKNLRNLKFDPLFSVNKNKKVGEQDNRKETKLDFKKPINRKLGLSLFSSEEEKSNINEESRVKDIMELLKKAHSFKDDPNFDIRVVINYKNTG